VDRIDIQQRLRRSARDSRDADRHKLETLQRSLASLLVELNRLQTAAGVFPSAQLATRSDDDVWDDWDNIVEILDEGNAPETPSSPSATPTSEESDNETQKLHIPSNHNVTPTHDAIELELRINQAKIHLIQLRELIAEKSSQYSDIIRAAPRKGVRTRARGTVKGINFRISFHCQVYSHCRSQMIQLGADEELLRRFQQLRKDDIKSSTAILRPNIPGSTTLHLSWIWQDVTRHILPDADGPLSATDAATILECKFSFSK
jgi:hypothetical protein